MQQSILGIAEPYLIKTDPILGKLIKSQKLILREVRPDYYTSLTRVIIGQQISVASANATADRFQKATNYSPTKAMALTDQETRAVGLSRQKASYIRDLSAHFLNNPQLFNHLDKLSDEEVISELVKVKGIGIWTAQMFLMFTLDRPDVFAPADVGLQRAMINLYGWEKLPEKAELEKTAITWQPYRTVACLHLWQSLHNTPG